MKIRDLTEEEKEILKKEIERLEAEIYIKTEKLDSYKITPNEVKIIELEISYLQEELASWQAEYNLGVYFPHKWDGRD